MPALRSKLKLLPHEYDLEGKDLIAYELTGRGLKSLQHECPLLAESGRPRLVAANLFTNYVNHVARTEIDFPVVITQSMASAA